MLTRKKRFTDAEIVKAWQNKRIVIKSKGQSINYTKRDTAKCAAFRFIFVIVTLFRPARIFPLQIKEGLKPY